jgi:two-component system, NarL family, nitrate/nitrite response regulator NarL
VSARIRLGVIDRHPLFRAGVIYSLGMVGDCQVVGEGSSLDDALRIAAEAQPHVLLIDSHAAFQEQGLDRLTLKFPDTRLIVLTTAVDREQVTAALQAGAAGYVLKGLSAAQLVESIRRVHRGERYIDPSLAGALLSRPVPTKPDPFSRLTPREVQVLDRVAQGLSNKEIARQLNLAPATVKHHLTELFGKLEVRSRVELALLNQSRPRELQHLPIAKTVTQDTTHAVEGTSSGGPSATGIRKSRTTITSEVLSAKPCEQL